jgi:hypothetical protein
MRFIRSGVIVLALAAGLCGRALACSQCLCGTPFPADLLGGVVPAQITFGLEERYLSKTNGLEEGPGDEQEREHRIAGFALWRPGNRLALLGRVPYNFKEITTRPLGEVESAQSSSGLGDVEVLALAGLARGAGRFPVSVGLVFGGVAPTGSNIARDAAGERLDAHLQPGTGAWSGTCGLHFALPGSSGVWDASVLGRINGTNAHGYRYGNVLLYNAGFTSGGWRGAQLLVQINGRSARQDRLEDGTLGENTGGAVTYAAPGIRWRSGVGLIAEAAVQVPVVQALYGEQKEHTTARMMLSFDR